MPQVFQVLKCYKCFVFQIHQTKKCNKFECKVCGVKQSIKRHYGIGTGKDCRMHVQKLNVLRGKEEVKPGTKGTSEQYKNSDINKGLLEKCKSSVIDSLNKSKWSEFVDIEEDTRVSEPSMCFGDKEEFTQSATSKVNTYTKDCSNVDLKSNMELYYNNKVIESENILLCNQNIEISNEKQLTNNDIIMKTEKHFLQTYNNNSKWSKFINTDENKDIDNNVSSEFDESEYVFKPNNLFSLCDELDIDKVLDL